MPIRALLRHLLPDRRRVVTAWRAAAVLLVALAGSSAAAGAEGANLPKVLRYAFRIAETGFDPAQISDLYSRNIAGNIFEAPYGLEFLARPIRMAPKTAAALPEVSADFTTFTVRIRPGTYFTDDPAFKGMRRELTAEDYVYSIKRLYDPRWKSPHYSSLLTYHVLGIEEVRRAALAGQPFDYDRPVKGLRAVDRYTIRFQFEEASPRFAVDILTDSSVVGAVAREVVEAHTETIMQYPVGTGPFKLGAWKRSSKVVLDRNPGYREAYYDEHPPAGEPLLQAAASALKGRRLPLVDRIEISIIEESQPRWLSFLNSEMDLLEQVPEDFTYVAIPNDKLAPNLVKRGIQSVRYARSDLSVIYFSMENLLVGGYTPQKVALRRAIGLALNVGEEIRIARRGQAIPGQSPMGPGVYGYDPGFKSEMSDFDRPRAKALLDLHGYVDRDGDGWREQPDGSPLTLEYATEPDDFRRQLATLFKKNMDAVGLRMVLKIAKWPENLKASRGGKLMMWGLGFTAGPDGDGFLLLGYGPSKGQGNYARFDLPEYNRVYEAQKRLPDGPERLALMDKAKQLLVAYMPYKVTAHRIYTDLAQPWVVGYHRNVFMRDWWHLVDIDSAELAKRAP